MQQLLILLATQMPFLLCQNYVHKMDSVSALLLLFKVRLTMQKFSVAKLNKNKEGKCWKRELKASLVTTAVELRLM